MVSKFIFAMLIIYVIDFTYNLKISSIRSMNFYMSNRQI